MKTCRRCGFHNMDEERRCVRCRSILDGSMAAADPLDDPAAETMDFDPGEVPRRFRPANLLWRVAGPAGRRWWRLREALRSEIPTDIDERNPWLAGWLSFIPGMGQLYNRQPKKMLQVQLAVGAALGAAWATIYHPLSNWILLGTLGVLILAWHDAVMSAKRINRDYMTRQQSIAFFFAWIFFVSFFCIAVQFMGNHFLLRFYYMHSDLASPALVRGERVAVDMLSYHARSPRLGEVVYYKPTQITMERPSGGVMLSDLLIVKPTDKIERVVAGPGQTFERREDGFYRDGVRVPPGEEPLVQDQLPGRFTLTAPPGHFVVLFSYTGGWMSPVGSRQAPPLNAPGWIIQGWREACVVPRKAIQGRVWCVYQPPPSRRWVR